MHKTTNAVDVVAGPEGTAMFLDLPMNIYRKDPFFCTPSQSKVHSGVFRRGFTDRQEMFIAVRNGRPVARLLARVSPALFNTSGKPFGMISFFEAENDWEAIQRLFDSATAWLQKHGAGTIIGPMDGDTWHSYRLNIGPFGIPPFLLEPYNPPYYRELWERYGFEEFESYYSKYVTNLEAAITNTDPISRRATTRGYRLRNIDLHKFDAELEVLYGLSKKIFAGNLLYTDIAFPEFRSLYRDSLPLLDRDLILFAQSPDGKDIGFVFAFADNIKAVRAMRGRRNLFAMLKFALLKNTSSAINVKTLGVIPEYRGSGVVLLLMNRMYRTVLDRGCGRANLCLIRDGNASGRMDGDQGTTFRQYILYKLPGGVLRAGK